MVRINFLRSALMTPHQSRRCLERSQNKVSESRSLLKCGILAHHRPDEQIRVSWIRFQSDWQRGPIRFYDAWPFSYSPDLRPSLFRNVEMFRHSLCPGGLSVKANGSTGMLSCMSFVAWTLISRHTPNFGTSVKHPLPHHIARIGPPNYWWLLLCL